MENLEDLAKVASVNIAAYTLSFSDLETLLRISGLAMALLYTCLKIVQLLKKWNKNG